MELLVFDNIVTCTVNSNIALSICDIVSTKKYLILLVFNNIVTCTVNNNIALSICNSVNT